MDKGLMIYIVDEGKRETLCLCPTKRGGSATADEVRDLGEDEDCGRGEDALRAVEAYLEVA